MKEIVLWLAYGFGSVAIIVLCLMAFLPLCPTNYTKEE